VVDGGERRLRLAVLEDAIACFQKHAGARHSRGRRLFREAEAWIMEGGQNSAYSFEEVCDALGLDSNCLRDGLRQWSERQAARPRTRRARLERRCRPSCI
jgi:hypothetical protein